MGLSFCGLCGLFVSLGLISALILFIDLETPCRKCGSHFRYLISRQEKENICGGVLASKREYRCCIFCGTKMLQKKSSRICKDYHGSLAPKTLWIP